MGGISGLFNALSTIFSLGRIGVGISNTMDNRREISRQRGMYEQQMAINSQHAEFNERVAVRAGRIKSAQVIDQTATLVSYISNKAASRGLDPEGSSTTLGVELATTVGLQAAYETMFDTEVQIANLKLQQQYRNAQGQAQLSNLNLMQQQNTNNMIDLFLQGGSALMTFAENRFMENKLANAAPRRISTLI